MKLQIPVTALSHKLVTCRLLDKLASNTREAGYTVDKTKNSNKTKVVPII